MKHNLEQNPGCLGINRVGGLRKLENQRFVITLGRANTKNRAGVFIERLSEDVIDIYNRRPSSNRLVCFRPTGKDSIVGEAISTTMVNTLSMVCGSVGSLKATETPGGIQVISAVIKIDGHKGDILKSLIEDDIENTLVFGHRFVCDRTSKGFTVTNIVGYDLLGNAL